MIRAKILNLDILKILKEAEDKGIKTLNIDGYPVNTHSDRYDNFRQNGFVCSHCGLVASYAAIEKHKTDVSYHINVYGIDLEGKEILFTKDHIYPQSKGGYNNICNYQVMCEVCNQNKADFTNITQEEAIDKGLLSPQVAKNKANIYEKKQEILSLKQQIITFDEKIKKIKQEIKQLYRSNNHIQNSKKGDYEEWN